MAQKRNSRKRRKAVTKKALEQIEREAKRAAQKAAGALDGRFRTKKVDSKKRYSRKRPPPDPDSER